MRVGGVPPPDGQPTTGLMVGRQTGMRTGRLVLWLLPGGLTAAVAASGTAEQAAGVTVIIAVADRPAGSRTVVDSPVGWAGASRRPLPSRSTRTEYPTIEQVVEPRLVSTTRKRWVPAEPWPSCTSGESEAAGHVWAPVEWVALLGRMEGGTAG